MRRTRIRRDQEVRRMKRRNSCDKPLDPRDGGGGRWTVGDGRGGRRAGAGGVGAQGRTTTRSQRVTRDPAGQEREDGWRSFACTTRPRLPDTPGRPGARTVIGIRVVAGGTGEE